MPTSFELSMSSCWARKVSVLCKISLVQRILNDWPFLGCSDSHAKIAL